MKHKHNSMADESPAKKKKTDNFSRNEGEKKKLKKWKEQKKQKRQQNELNLIQELEKQKTNVKNKDENAKESQQDKKESKGRPYTVSVALPGSVLDNAQSPELRTYLAGQIARACVVFCVDEVVIFDEQGEDTKSVEGEFRGVGKKGQACVQLARILQYLECPQYLRKFLFPMHRDLTFAGLLNPLDSPHHMRIDEEAEFREGVVLNRPCKPGRGSFVNCGMRKQVTIDKELQAGLRVTVRMHKGQEGKVCRGAVVAPHVPTTEAGLYWGYSVRLASCLSSVFSESPYAEGYDLSVGTSEKGTSADHVTLSPFKHLLVVFGGLDGLEASVESDENLNISDPALLFHHYLNTCPAQGSRTIRTEEAILISLSVLRPKITALFQG